MALTKKVFLLALLACATAAVVSVVLLSLGREGKLVSTAGGAVTTSAPYPPAAVSRASKGTRIRYLESKGVVQPGQDNGFSYKCPKQTPNAVSGYFYAVRDEADGKLVPAGSYPFGRSNRGWAVGVVNLGTQPEEFVVGVVCIR